MDGSPFLLFQDGSPFLLYKHSSTSHEFFVLLTDPRKGYNYQELPYFLDLAIYSQVLPSLTVSFSTVSFSSP
jgi:hypothetical protein